MKIAIYGSGQGAEIIAEAALSSGFTINHFIDDDLLLVHKWKKMSNGCSYIIQPKEEHLLYHKEMYVATEIFSPIVREKIHREMKCISIIHPEAYVSPTVKIEDGCFVKAGAVIDGQNTIGEGCFIDNGVVITHHSNIGPYNNVCAGTIIGSSVTTGERVIIGMNVTICTGVTIANDCEIMSGSVITNDILEEGTIIKRRIN